MYECWLVCVIMYHVHSGQYLWRTEEGARSTGTEGADCVSRHHACARNGTQSQQSVLFTAKPLSHLLPGLVNHSPTPFTLLFCFFCSLDAFFFHSFYFFIGKHSHRCINQTHQWHPKLRKHKKWKLGSRDKIVPFLYLITGFPW